MSRPLIALLTDFGSVDHYVGTMKGVMLGVCPEATLVDLSHEVPAQDVRAGARLLAASYTYFPAGTVFLAVVDPGVGSGRHALAVAAGGYHFVAPDNGLLSAVFGESPPSRVVALSEPAFARPTISRTFEGRDRFAPAAGWLASGVDIASLGPELHSWVRLDWPVPIDVPGGIDGVVESVDRFGNLVTNIDRGRLDATRGADAVHVRVTGTVVTRIVATYADARLGELCALVGSSERLEVAVNGGSAAIVLGAAAGTPVQLRRGASEVV